MSTFNEILPAGRYILNEGLIVNIVHTRMGVIIRMLDSQSVGITNSAQSGSGWNIWYTINQKEQTAHVIKAPNR